MIDDREILDQIPAVHLYSKMVRQVSVAIVVCGNLQRERHQVYWI